MAQGAVAFCRKRAWREACSPATPSGGKFHRKRRTRPCNPVAAMSRRQPPGALGSVLRPRLRGGGLAGLVDHDLDLAVFPGGLPSRRGRGGGLLRRRSKARLRPRGPLRCWRGTPPVRHPGDLLGAPRYACVASVRQREVSRVLRWRHARGGTSPSGEWYGGGTEHRVSPWLDRGVAGVTFQDRNGTNQRTEGGAMEPSGARGGAAVMVVRAPIAPGLAPSPCGCSSVARSCTRESRS